MCILLSASRPLLSASVTRSSAKRALASISVIIFSASLACCSAVRALSVSLAICSIGEHQRKVNVNSKSTFLPVWHPLSLTGELLIEAIDIQRNNSSTYRWLILPADILSASVALSSAVCSLLSVSPDLLSASLARCSASRALLSASVTRLDSTKEDDD